MSNKKLYKDTFDKIVMSEEVFGKVRNMNMEEKKIKRKVSFRFATVLAALTVIFALSNGIAYAATGSTLVERVANIYIDYSKKDLRINGEKQEIFSDVIDRPGHYTFVHEDGTQDEIDVDYEYYGTLKEENGEVYLIVDDREIDITEDFKDGKAEGEFELKGVSYQYTVEGSISENNIIIDKK